MILLIGDREYTLHFSVNAVCEMEQRMGKSLYDVIASGVSAVRSLLWCGLYEKYALTISQAGALVEEYLKEGDLPTLFRALCDGISDAGFFR